MTRRATGRPKCQRPSSHSRWRDKELKHSMKRHLSSSCALLSCVCFVLFPDFVRLSFTPTPYTCAWSSSPNQPGCGRELWPKVFRSFPCKAQPSRFSSQQVFRARELKKGISPAPFLVAAASCIATSGCTT